MAFYFLSEKKGMFPLYFSILFLVLNCYPESQLWKIIDKKNYLPVIVYSVDVIYLTSGYTNVPIEADI